MSVSFFKDSTIKDLFSSIEANLEQYREGDFSMILDNHSLLFPTKLEIDFDKISSIFCDHHDLREVKNSLLIYEAIGDISHYLARDSRLWIMLTHTVMFNYTKNRWPIPEDNEKAIKHIKTHFFGLGQRGIERDNAASRLWWLASLCARIDDLSLEDALECFLYKSDVRANIVERPTTSQNINVFSAILKRLNQSFQGNQELFERARFRELMTELNLIGGVRLLAALPDEILHEIVDDCVEQSV